MHCSWMQGGEVPLWGRQGQQEARWPERQHRRRCPWTGLCSPRHRPGHRLPATPPRRLQSQNPIQNLLWHSRLIRCLTTNRWANWIALFGKLLSRLALQKQSHETGFPPALSSSPASPLAASSASSSSSSSSSSSYSSSSSSSSSSSLQPCHQNAHHQHAYYAVRCDDLGNTYEHGTACTSMHA